MQNIRNLIRVSMSVVIPRLTKWLFTNSRRDFDYVNNVDTAGGLEVEAMSVKGHSPEERCGYVPTSAKHFAFAMSFVPEPLDAWSFVDIGSGKGRVVMLAIGYPFRRVIGVELAPELHAIAQENLSRFRGPRRLRAALATRVAAKRSICSAVTPPPSQSHLATSWCSCTIRLAAHSCAGFSITSRESWPRPRGA